MRSPSRPSTSSCRGWSKYGKKFYFIGSDYNYPHVTNGLAKDILVAQGGQSVGEEYAALGTTEFSAMLARIQKAKPDLVFGNLVGTDAVAFMKQFYDAGLSKQMGLYEPIDQSFVPAIGVEQCEGVAVCQGYLEQSGYADQPGVRRGLEED